MKKYVYYKETEWLGQEGREFIGIPGDDNFWIRRPRADGRRGWYQVTAGNSNLRYKHPKDLGDIKVEEWTEYESLDDPMFILDQL